MAYVNFKEEKYKGKIQIEKRKKNNEAITQYILRHKDNLKGFYPNFKYSFKKIIDKNIGKEGLLGEDAFQDIIGKDIICTNFIDCTFKNIRFKDCRFIGCVFDGCTFNEGGVVFENCIFTKEDSEKLPSLNRKDNLGCSFYNCNVYSKFINSDISYAIFENSKIMNTNIELHLKGKHNLNNIMESDDNIVCFGQNNTPDILFNHLYPNIGVDTYVAGVSDIAPIAMSGKINNEEVDYCIIAEPVLFNVLNNKNALTYGKGSEYSNFQAKWKEIHGNDSSILGASIYIKNETYQNHSNVVNSFLNNIKSDINTYVNNPEKAIELLDNYGSKEFAVFGLPIFMMLIQALLCIISDISNKGENKYKITTIAKWIIPILTVIIYFMTIGIALGYNNIDVRKIVCFCLGIIFILIGNYIPRVA